MQAIKKRLSGWSLIELTIILVVLSILCAILAPVIGRFVRNAKMCRAREDVQAIGCAIWMCIEDTANSYFMKQGGKPSNPGAERMNDGGAPSQHYRNRINLLVSDGDIPELQDDVARDADEWVRKASDSDVDFLEYHLVTNNPKESTRVAYRTPSDLTNDDSDDPMFARTESGGFNSEFAWRGPYLTPPIDPDPWGNRYAVNVMFLDPLADTEGEDAARNGFEEDTAVLSAGPDEEVDTVWAQDGLTPGDDDIIYTLSSNSRP